MRPVVRISAERLLRALRLRAHALAGRIDERRKRQAAPRSARETGRAKP